MLGDPGYPGCPVSWVLNIVCVVVNATEDEATRELLAGDDDATIELLAGPEVLDEPDDEAVVDDDATIEEKAMDDADTEEDAEETVCGNVKTTAKIIAVTTTTTAITIPAMAPPDKFAGLFGIVLAAFSIKIVSIS